MVTCGATAGFHPAIDLRHIFFRQVEVLGSTLGSKADLLARLSELLQIPGRELVRGAAGIAEGLPEAVADSTLPKFRPGGLLVVHCGGGAGLFSAMIGGWASGALGSAPVMREIRP